MRYIAIVFSLTALLCINTTAYSQDAMSVWDTSGIRIDGKFKEWPSFFRFYISGAKLQFDFCNDSSNVYICIKAVDMEAQSRLMHSGVDLWFDPMGKKKQKTGISFPMKLEGAPGDAPRRMRANSDPSSEPSERSRASKLRERVLFAQNIIKVTGMIDVKEPEISLQNKYGIEIAYDWDSLNILAIEYKIPLSLILQHPVQASDMLHPMGMAIAVGAVESNHAATAPESHSQSGQQRGMGGGGMGGNGAGSRGGGGRGGNSQNNLANDRFNNDGSEQKVWLKVHWDTKPIQ